MAKVKLDKKQDQIYAVYKKPTLHIKYIETNNKDRKRYTMLTLIKRKLDKGDFSTKNNTIKHLSVLNFKVSVLTGS